MKFWEKFGDYDNDNYKVALIQNDQSVTYRQLDAEVNNIVSLHSVRKLAFLLCSNSIESITIYLALLRAEIPVVMVNGQIEEGLLTNLIDTYKPYYIWTFDNRIINGYSLCDVFKNYKLIKRYELYDCDINSELGVMLTTSGSTGSPKLVRQSYKNISSNTESIVEYLHIDSNDCTITTLPMHYTYGLSIINTHIAKGATIVLTDLTPLHKGFWRLLKQYQVTSFGGVPYTYEILKRVHFFEKDISSLRYITQAGGRLGVELHREFAEGCKKNNIEFYVMYGQTEATARMSYLPPEKTLDKIGSIGIAIPNGKFWLLDSSENEICSPDTPGELIYSGDNVTMGYAESLEDLKKGYSNGNVLHTGDVAKYDQDGFLYVVGRLKRFLKIYGNRVNLDEVEMILKKEGISEVVACGVDDHLKICVTKKDDMNKVSNIILNNTNIPRFGFKTYLVDAIPRNSSGKILYNELEQSLK